MRKSNASSWRMWRRWSQGATALPGMTGDWWETNSWVFKAKSVRDMTIGVWNREAKFIWWYKQALSPHFPSFCFILSDWNGRGLGAQFPPVAGQLRSWRILCLEEGWGWEDDRNFKRNQPWYHWYHICGGFHRWGYPRYSKMDGL